MEKDGNEERESWRAGGISSNDFKEKKKKKKKEEEKQEGEEKEAKSWDER